MEPSQTDETSTSSHFFDFDLPLPLARRLGLGKIPPPEAVRAAREEIATLGPALHLCHLSPEERALLDVPVQPDFQMFNHGSRLSHYLYLIKFAPHSSRVRPEDLDRLSACKYNLSGLRYLISYTREAATAGVLISLLLLTRGVRRVEETARARRGEAARRWQRIVSLCAQARTRTQAGASAPPPPSEDHAGPPRDLDTLRAAVCQAQGYRAASERLIELVCGLNMPLQTDATHMPRCADLGVDWKRDVDAGCVTLSEAILRDLYPALPSLADECGVRPASLSYLRGWYREFSLLLDQAEQYQADLTDSERLFWSQARASIRQIHTDVVDYLCGPGDTAEQRALFYQLCFTLQQARSRPAPEALRESIRAGRRRSLERLVFVSDLAEP
jgi:hypothetical protein